jgi:endonuclease/exonuclease/phosphatase family metal-dependent hydrolase
VLAAGALLVATAPVADGAKRTADVRVMTRNLYLGADLVPLAAAQPGEEFERAAGRLLEQVTTNEYEARMKIVAGEIAAAKPDLVGLQEVVTWRVGPKDDPAPATEVRVDYLAALRRELRAEGARYRVVADRRTLEIEGPSDRGVDVRGSGGNVVLARKGVRVSRARSRDFRNQIVVPTRALGPVEVTRSFSALDARVRGARFHFVNTHLESFAPDVRLDQARELTGGPLRSRLQTVLVGDLNSGPDFDDAADRRPYEAIASAGFRPARNGMPTCCFEQLQTGVWDRIVDWVMTRPRVRLVRSFNTGLERTPGGRYPSDHGGVVSVLRLRR